MRGGGILGRGLLAGLAAGILTTGTAYADPALGTIFYTTFAGGTNVWKVDYNYNGSSLTLTNNTGVAATNGADGILFAPDGNLIVAGQSSNTLHEITTAGAAVANAGAGTGAYHMALGPANELYTMWNGLGGGGTTAIGQQTLSGGGLVNASVGTPLTVVCGLGCTSTDVRGLIFDPINSTWYFGSAPDNGLGQFGTVSFVGTTATLTPILSGVAAHGLTYDPFTQDIIMSAGGTIQQFDVGSNSIIGAFSSPGQSLDQTAVDGKGHLFGASNTGNLLFLDYDTTGNIGASLFSSLQFLNNNLDDIAPLSGAGSNAAVPEPASLLLLGTGLLGVARRRFRSIL